MPILVYITGLIVASTLIAITYFDFFIFEMSLNSAPDFTTYGALKSLLIACLAILLVGGIVLGGRVSGRPGAAPLESKAAIVVIYLFTLGSVLLFCLSPKAFNKYGSEDSIVEYMSALLLLVGAILFLQAYLLARRIIRKSISRRLSLWAAPLCAILLFLIVMEEISWMQRILGFGTPEMFAGNKQGETNLHNFVTTPVDALYKLGGWASLILLPFVVSFGPRLPFEEQVRDFLPPPWIAALCAPLAGFNYNAWPQAPTQFIAFTTVLMMVLFSLRARRNGQAAEALLFAVGAALVVVAQTVFLLAGRNFVRLWDVTEYQEFYIALGLAAVAWSTKRCFQRRFPAQSNAALRAFDDSRR